MSRKTFPAPFASMLLIVSEGHRVVFLCDCAIVVELVSLVCNGLMSDVRHQQHDALNMGTVTTWVLT